MAPLANYKWYWDHILLLICFYACQKYMLLLLNWVKSKFRVILNCFYKLIGVIVLIQTMNNYIGRIPIWGGKILEVLGKRMNCSKNCTIRFLFNEILTVNAQNADHAFILKLTPTKERLVYSLEDSWCHVNFIHDNSYSRHEIFSRVHKRFLYLRFHVPPEEKIQWIEVMWVRRPRDRSTTAHSARCGIFKKLRTVMEKMCKGSIMHKPRVSLDGEWNNL